MTTESCELFSILKCCLNHLIFVSLNEEVVVSVQPIWDIGLAFGRDLLNTGRERLIRTWLIRSST